MPRNDVPAPIRHGSAFGIEDPEADSVRAARQAQFFEPPALTTARRALRRAICAVAVLGFLFAAALPFLI